MEYVFQELSMEDIALLKEEIALKFTPEPTPVMPEVVFQDISLEDIDVETANSIKVNAETKGIFSAFTFEELALKISHSKP